MKLLEIQISNFRSFGTKDEKQVITFRKGINTVVGENNVGKSSILKILDLFKGHYSFSPEDSYKGETTNPVSMSLQVELTYDEFRLLMRKAVRADIDSREQKEVQNLMKTLGSNVTIQYLSSKNPPVQIQFDEFHRRYANPIAGAILDQEIRKFIEIEIKINNERYFLELLNEKLKVFAEIRKRPSGKNQALLESLDAEFLADVLATLKNGNNQQRRKFEFIKAEFRKFFPNLNLEVMGRPTEVPTIMIEKEPINYEVSIVRVGAGIGEIITLITHLIASEDMIFGLDMPELHLHPHAQRMLLRVLEKYSEKNQFLLITHSPTFLDTEKLQNVIVIRDVVGKAVVTELQDNCFSEEEKCKLDRCLDSHNKEFLFSKAVVVVEGETELGALPVFSRNLQMDFDTFGISLVRTGKHFGLFIKLAKCLGFPYLVICDKDALMNIENTIENNNQKIKTSPVFFNLSIAGLLEDSTKEIISGFQPAITKVNEKEVYSNQIFEELRGIAKNYRIRVLSSDFEGVLVDSGYKDILEKASETSNSKVSCGKMVAEDIVEQKLEVPIEFRDAINDAVKLVGFHN